MAVSDISNHTKRRVKVRYEELMATACRDSVISLSIVTQYFRVLYCVCFPGLHDVMAEHRNYPTESKEPSNVSTVLTMYVHFGMVPRSFWEGVFAPFLRKPTLDPSVSEKYRRVTVSSILSEILELYFLDMLSHNDFDKDLFQEEPT